MEYITTITKKGQLTIPKELREFFEITKPGKVTLFLHKKEKSVSFKQVHFLELAGAFKPKDKIENPVKLQAYIKTAYKKT